MNYFLRTASLTTLFLLSSVAFAAPPDDARGWHLRLGATSILPSTGDFDDSLGVALGVGYRFSNRVGIELEVAHSDLDQSVHIEFLTAAFTLRSSLDVTPVLAHVDFHLTPNRRVDVYVGPTVGWLRTSDLAFSTSGDILANLRLFPATVPTEDTFVWGGHLGVDVPFGDPRRGAFFTGRLTVLDARIDVQRPSPDLELDPVMAQVGIGYRF